MAINYTSLLALIQPVDGTEVSVWVDDVNNGVSSILDVAVAGTQNITTDANVTLTITQATSSGTNLSSTSAQYAILLLSGARTATRTVTLPASSKTYTVMNSTTGGYAQTVGGLTIAVGEYCQIAYNTSSSSWVKTSTQSGAGTFSSITNTGLTSGRVVYSTTGGLETDSANLTFDGTNLTLGGGTANGVAYLNGSKVLTTEAALTFDGTNLGVGVTATAPITLRTTSGYLSQDIVGDATNGWSSLRFRNAANNATNVFFNYDNGAFKFGTVNSEPIVFNTANSEQMRLTSTGLGIGTSSPTFGTGIGLHIQNSTRPNIRMTQSSSSDGYEMFVSGTTLYPADNVGASGGAVIWRNTATRSETMRIDSSGNLILGATSAFTNANSIALAGTQIVQGHINGTSSGTNYTNFLYNSTSIGSISQNGTSGVLYNTSSDQRLKTDLGTVTSTDVIANTVIHDFTWKTDGSQARGVFAQEAAKVLPAAVKVGDDGEEVTDQWQVDYSKYVPDIIVELQSLRAEIAALKSQLKG